LAWVAGRLSKFGLFGQLPRQDKAKKRKAFFFEKKNQKTFIY